MEVHGAFVLSFWLPVQGRRPVLLCNAHHNRAAVNLLVPPDMEKRGYTVRLRQCPQKQDLIPIAPVFRTLPGSPSMEHSCKRHIMINLKSTHRSTGGDDERPSGEQSELAQGWLKKRADQGAPTIT